MEEEGEEKVAGEKAACGRERDCHRSGAALVCVCGRETATGLRGYKARVAGESY